MKQLVLYNFSNLIFVINRSFKSSSIERKHQGLLRFTKADRVKFVSMEKQTNCGSDRLGLHSGCLIPSLGFLIYETDTIIGPSRVVVKSKSGHVSRGLSIVPGSL